jgi:hypothetical protein
MRILGHYNRLVQDWREFNDLLWKIPSVAVSIMAGIVVAAYQPYLTGSPRIISLAIGSLFLLALSLEVINLIKIVLQGLSYFILIPADQSLKSYSVVRQDALFNVGDGIILVEKYCDVCAKNVK